ncbi:MAG: OmpA/MotB family protein [Armatimonadota bacterium]
MGRRRKAHEEGHGNSERWLLTYADMITLLMAFFIMMYSMSVLNLAKFNAVAFSIRSGFGGILSGRGPHVLEHEQTGRTDFPATRNILGDEAAEIAERRLKSFVNENNMQTQVEVTLEERGLVISVSTDDLLFSRGSAELSAQANELLERIVALLKTMRQDIMVEGHTCSIPINTREFPSNWELSTARACRVLRYLGTSGIAERRLSAAGYADTRPRQMNNSEKNRTRNRRVDIVLLTQSHWPGTPNAAATAAATVTPDVVPVPRTMIRIKPNLAKVREAGDAPPPAKAAPEKKGHLL